MLGVLQQEDRLRPDSSVRCSLGDSDAFRDHFHAGGGPRASVSPRAPGPWDPPPMPYYLPSSLHPLQALVKFLLFPVPPAYHAAWPMAGAGSLSLLSHLCALSPATLASSLPTRRMGTACT